MLSFSFDLYLTASCPFSGSGHLRHAHVEGLTLATMVTLIPPLSLSTPNACMNIMGPKQSQTHPAMRDSIKFVRLIPGDVEEPTSSSCDTSPVDTSTSPSDHPSWSSLDDESPTTHDGLCRKDHPETKTAAARGPRAQSTSTADMAFFLKNTGPPCGKKTNATENSKAGSKALPALGIFKRPKVRKGRSKSEDSGRPRSRNGRISVPYSLSTNVVQRRTTNGEPLFTPHANDLTDSI